MQESKTGKWHRVLHGHEQNFVLLGTAYAAALYVHHGFSNSIRSQIILYLSLVSVSLLSYKTIVPML